MSCRRRGYLAGVLGYARIQVFPEIRIQKNLDSGLPGLADRHLRETTVFPDLLIGISGETTGFPEKLFHDEFFASARNISG